MFCGHLRQSEGIDKLAKSKQSAIGGDAGTTELQLQTAVEIQPQEARFAFTRRVNHSGFSNLTTTH